MAIDVVLDEPPIAISEIRQATEMTPVMDKLQQGYLSLIGKGEKGSIITLLSEGLGWTNNPEGSYPLLEKALFSARFSPQETNSLRSVFLSLGDTLDDLLARMDISPEDESFKLEWATINQKFAAEIFGLGEPAKDEADRRKKAETALTIQVLKLLSGYGLPGTIYSQEGFLIYLNGALAQAGLMRVLTDNHYAVFAPKWEDPEEIRKLDLQGVDMIAVGEKAVFFIDVKGRSKIKEEGVLRTNYMATCQTTSLKTAVLDEALGMLKSKLAERYLEKEEVLQKKPLIACRVIIPSNSLDLHGRIIEEKTKQEILGGLQRLCPERRKI
jgi:hypothetical protein